MVLSRIAVFICLYIGFLHNSYCNTNSSASYYLIRSLYYSKKIFYFPCVVLEEIMTFTTPYRFWRRGAYRCDDLRTSGVACLAEKSLAIWVNEVEGKIMTASYPKTRNTSQVLLHRGFGSVNHIVVDWISYNVYWADSMYEWIAMKSVWSSDERSFRVVQDTWMRDVWSLAIAPTRRFLFWASNSKDAAIVRSSLTGSESRSIVWRGVNNVTAMAFDDISGRVYWASATWNSVQRCDVDGGNREVFLTGQLSFSGLTIISSHNLLIATSTSTNHIFYFNTTQSQRWSYSGPLINQATYNDISSCEDREHVGKNDNPCLKRGCQHICVAEKDNSITCLCYNGFRMHHNGVNCTAEEIPQRSVIYVNGSNLCSFDISSNIDNRPAKFHPNFNVQCHNAKSNNLRYLAVDSNRGRLFYASKSAIAIMNMSSGNVSELVRNVSNVKGVTYDWLRDTLYWIEGGRWWDTVRYTDRGSPGLVTDLSNGTIADITVDPFHRYLYVAYGKASFNDSVTGPAVYRISLDTDVKATRHIRVFTNVNHNSRIYYDAITNRVYLSYNGQLISTPSVAGPPSLRRSVHRDDEQKSTALVVYKKYLVVMMDGGMWINKVEREVPTLGTVTDVVVYDPITQPDNIDSCLVENGGCQQLCAKVHDEKHCECYLGYNKSIDPSSGRVICQSHPVLDRFLLLADTYGGYYQLSLDNLSLAGIHSTGQQSYQYTSLAYSAKTKRVYWSHEKTIGGTLNLMSSTLNGSDVSTAINIGTTESISLVAIDQSTGNIYIVKDNTEMSVHTHDGQNGKPIKLKVKYIYSIALHPKKGVMYLAVGESTIQSGIYADSIAQSNMDGSNFKIMISAACRGVALDYDNEILYWADFVHGAIYYADPHGHHLVCEHRKAYSLAVFGDDVYFTTMSTSGILRVPKLGGRAEIVASPIEMGILQYLAVYNSQWQQQNKMCSENNGRCSTLCLPTATSYTCACSTPYYLTDNDRTCNNVHLCDPSKRGVEIASDCTRYAGSRCRFTCRAGYRRNHSVVHDFIDCKKDGQWNVSTDTLCWENAPPEPNVKSFETLSDVNRKLAIGFAVVGTIMLAAAAIAIKVALNRRKDRKSESDREPIIKETPKTRMFRRQESVKSEEYDEIDPINEDLKEDDGVFIPEKETIMMRDRCNGVHLPPALVSESDFYTAPKDELPLAAINTEKIEMDILRDRMHDNMSSSETDGAEIYFLSTDPLREQHRIDLMTRKNMKDFQYNNYYVLEGDEHLVFEEDRGLYTFADGAFCSDVCQSTSVYSDDTSSEFKNTASNRSGSISTRFGSVKCDPSVLYGTPNRSTVSESYSGNADDDVFDKGDDSIQDASKCLYDDFTAPNRIASKRLSQDTTNNRFRRTSLHSICRYCAAHASRSETSSGYESDLPCRSRFLSDPGGECNNGHETVYDPVYMPLRREPSYLRLVA